MPTYCSVFVAVMVASVLKASVPPAEIDDAEMVRSLAEFDVEPASRVALPEPSKAMSP